MNAAADVLKLFATIPPKGSGLEWWAEPLLAIVADGNDLELQRIPDTSTDPPRWLIVVQSAGTALRDTSSGFSRVFRPLLAYLASIAAQSAGVQFEPYGGTYCLQRTGMSGPVQISVSFSNTPGSQEITFTHLPMTNVPNRLPSSGSSTELPLASSPAT